MATTAQQESRRCQRCGDPLAGAELSGNCPRCLTALLLSPEPADAAEPSPIPVIRRLGDYELLEEVARGGMGVVFRARQVSLDRTVAVKVLRDAWLATPVQVKRFRAEAANAAKLKHPNIVAVHEVGEQGGQHYFAMDLIKGTNLAELTRDGPLPPQRAAELTRKVAEAVQHAHQQGVLHRDVKPSNVLLDPQGEPQVTDFGLARVLDDESSLTLSGQVLGTPGYIAPEQATGTGTVGPAADIYSLGALLYHLVTGRAPFVGGTVGETLRHVVEQEPVSPQLLNPEVPRDLASVCLKCLAKRPGDRYDSASVLADDLRRFICGEPTIARPAGHTERLWRWCQRKPALSAAIGCAVLIGAVGFAGVIWQWLRAERLATEEKRLREAAQRSELAVRQNAYVSDMLSVQQALANHSLGRARDLLLLHEPRKDQLDLRGWEWWYYAGQCKGDDVFTRSEGQRRVTGLVTSPLHNGVIAGSSDGSIELWDLAGRKVVARLPKEGEGIVALASDSEGRFLASQTTNGPVKVWDLSDLANVQLVRTLTTNFLYEANAFSSRNRLIALTTKPATEIPATIAEGGDDGLTGVWNWETGERVKVLDESGAGATFTADGRLLATGSWDGAVKIWSVEDWHLIHTLEPVGRVLNMEFSPDGKYLVTSNRRGDVLLWDVTGGRLVGLFRGHSSQVFKVAFSPDGQRLATASADQTIGLSEVATQRELFRFRGHEGVVRLLAFSPNGQLLASASSTDGTMRFWNAEAGKPTNVVVRLHSLPAFAPENRTVAVGNADGQIDLWDLETGALKETPPSEPNPLAFSQDGNVLITATARTPLPLQPNRIAGLKFWERGSRTPSKVVEFSPPNLIVSAARLSPDASLLATGDPQGKVIIWDTKTGTVRKQLNAGSERIWNLVFTADGSVLAIGLDGGEDGGETKLWNLNTGSLISVAGGGSAVAFSPDGTVVATGYYRTVRLWRTATGEELETLRGHREPVIWLAFAKDGRTLVSAAEEIKLWNLAARREVASFLPDAASVFVGFSPDGRHLLGGKVGEVHVWTAAKDADLSHLFKAHVARELSGIPPRSPDTPSQLIDLSSHYNASLTESWLGSPGPEKNDLAELPQGVHAFAGVRFDVRGLIQAGTTPARRYYPHRVTGIAVGLSCSRLHFLHATQWGIERPGTQIGNYVVHFANGQTHEIPIVLGQNVADWWSHIPERGMEFTVAWTGTNEATRARRTTTSLFKTTWKNPWPDVVIESIDFNWAGREGKPFLVAITAE